MELKTEVFVNGKRRSVIIEHSGSSCGSIFIMERNAPLTISKKDIIAVDNCSGIYEAVKRFLPLALKEDLDKFQITTGSGDRYWVWLE